MQGHNIYFNGELLKIIPELCLLPLPICRTNNNVPRFMPQTSIVSKKQPFKAWLVGCFGLNGPLRQYFSLYRAVSQREGERKEK